MADYTALLSLAFSNDREARAVADSLSVEAAAGLPKATTTVAREGAVVRIAIAAEDAATLRAGVNSFLRWASVAESAARAGTR